MDAGICQIVFVNDLMKHLLVYVLLESERGELYGSDVDEHVLVALDAQFRDFDCEVVLNG